MQVRGRTWKCGSNIVAKPTKPGTWNKYLLGLHLVITSDDRLERRKHTGKGRNTLVFAFFGPVTHNVLESLRDGDLFSLAALGLHVANVLFQLTLRNVVPFEAGFDDARADIMVNHEKMLGLGEAVGVTDVVLEELVVADEC